MTALRCTNSACRRTTLATWTFCASCGEDLRPPAFRTPVPLCEDHTITDGEHCIDCGRSILDVNDEEMDDGTLKIKVVAAWAALLVGGLTGGFGQLIMTAREGRAGPFNNLLKGLAQPGPIDPNHPPAGITVAYWCIRLGCLAVAAGIVALILLPSVKRRRFLG